ncbi:MAG: hypothetical protein A3H31_06745 [Gallionellales bacterium RIFCSPLOWO2_02_FULL_57_47]|nr:MAG: hypothetical protein A3H31_06745 [Gallionellales bacterium RIFCSPLOWO2_02_FULL_57_47]OGT11004.1 MAG: hypothetical protein A3J49_16310 [Gallionellales bacterium RIFCSPHIGHO2_02_FULL_57_16]
MKRLALLVINPADASPVPAEERTALPEVKVIGKNYVIIERRESTLQPVAFCRAAICRIPKLIFHP